MWTKIFTRRRLYTLLGIFGAVLFYLWLRIPVYNTLNGIPIDKIRINNGLKFTKPQDVTTALSDSGNSQKGFFSFDTETMMLQLQKYNWIQNIIVSKRFPDFVNVRITEKTPYALWTNGQQVGYITTNGDLFYSPNQLNLNNKLRELAMQGLDLKSSKQQEETTKQAVENYISNESGISPFDVLAEQKQNDQHFNQSLDLKTLTLLNRELFAKEHGSITDVDKLDNQIPVLISNKYYIKLALQYWLEIKDILKDSNLTFKEIRIDSSDSWHIMLSNGIVLNLDSNNIRETVERFVRASKDIKVPAGYFISYVDLRYRNGIAIKFVKEEDALQNPELVIKSLIPGQGGRILTNATFAPVKIEVDYNQDLN